MKRVLVLCDDTSPSAAGLSRSAFDKVLAISRFSAEPDLNLKLANITEAVVSDLDPRALDLLELSAFVFAADSDVYRGPDADILADRWERDFAFVVPCRNPDLWNSGPVRGLLETMLGFLSGDRYSFYFVKAQQRREQAFLEYAHTDLPVFGGADCVALFSGGLDSLAGVVADVRGGKRPLLVSHRSRPTLASLQTRLVKLLQERISGWHFPHVRLWVNRRGQRRAEYTQRTRSFLYLSLATAVAWQCGLDEIRFFENGVVSFNLPLLGNNVGALLTRTTHPKFVSEFQDLLGLVLPKQIGVVNPFTLMTKGEVARTLEDNGVGELIGASVSCAHAWMMDSGRPQCGTCSQCVDRRFAIASQELGARDPVYGYQKNVFLDPLEEGPEKACAIGYTRTFVGISKMSDTEFFSAFPQLYDAIPYMVPSSAQAAREVYGLFRRQADQVVSVLQRKLAEHSGALIADKLPDSCLVAMIGSRQHLNVPSATGRGGGSEQGRNAGVDVRQGDKSIAVVGTVGPVIVTVEHGQRAQSPSHEAAAATPSEREDEAPPQSTPARTEATAELEAKVEQVKARVEKLERRLASHALARMGALAVREVVLLAGQEFDEAARKRWKRRCRSCVVSTEGDRGATMYDPRKVADVLEKEGILPQLGALAAERFPRTLTETRKLTSQEREALEVLFSEWFRSYAVPESTFPGVQGRMDRDDAKVVIAGYASERLAQRGGRVTRREFEEAIAWAEAQAAEWYAQERSGWQPSGGKGRDMDAFEDTRAESPLDAAARREEEPPTQG